LIACGNGSLTPVSDAPSSATTLVLATTSTTANPYTTFKELGLDLTGRCPVDVAMAPGVVADPALPDPADPAVKEPMFVGLLQGESERRAVFDGVVTAIEPSPNSNSASWVTVESNGIVTIYTFGLDPTLARRTAPQRGGGGGSRERRFLLHPLRNT